MLVSVFSVKSVIQTVRIKSINKVIVVFFGLLLSL